MLVDANPANAQNSKALVFFLAVNLKFYFLERLNSWKKTKEFLLLFLDFSLVILFGHSFTIGEEDARGLSRGMQQPENIVVGDYVVGEWLMDNIFSGANSTTGEQVAVKVIDKDSLPPSKAKQLYTEVAVVQKLWGLYPKGFGKFIRMEENERQLFLITESLGRDLLSFLACKGRIAEREVKLIFGQICRALKMCHSAGITHHGLSLDRIWVSAHGQELETKISGFDRCCILERDGPLLSNFEDCSNQYAPPEIFKGKQYEGQSLDIYALGVVLYALLIGDLPFDDDDLDLQIEQKLSKNFLWSLHFPADVSSSARELVFSLLAPNPIKRATLDQVLQHPFFSHESQAESKRPSHDIDKEEFDVMQLHHSTEEEEEVLLRLFDRTEMEEEDSKDVFMGMLE